MVSLRCNNWVRSELNNLGICIVRIEPGMVELEDKLKADQLINLNKRISKLGMEILDAHQGKLMTEVIETIQTKIYSSDSNPTTNFLKKICKNLGHDYEVVSNLFSEVKGIDLPQYIVIQRIERVKEILVYEDWTLIRISKLLDYKNPAQLTRMFKNVTGLTPIYYKRLRKERLANVKEMSSTDSKLN